MTNRERLLAILAGRSPDRIPWIPRLQLWYNARLAEGNMPARFQGLSLRQVERALGVGNHGRGGRVFNLRREGFEVVTREKDGQALTKYVTPVGTVSELRVRTSQLDGYVDAGLLIEHPIKSVADYPVWEYIAEHTYYDPCYEAYRAFDRQLGDDGLPMVGAGDVPFHRFCHVLVGYNQAFYHLADYRPQVEHLLTVMTQCERERLWPVLADSPAVLFNHGVHLDSQMTSPPLFEQYIKPYYVELTKLLHARGQKLSYHADDDAKLILGLLKESGFDMGECFATAPMVTVTLAEARQAWGNDVIIWGGIPSVILEETTPDEEFEGYVREVFRTIAPGDAFILGISDNAMPRTKIERVERITKLVEEYGNYPIAAA
ncbi:MAG: hypothetical protein HYY04_15690 [Chloroflexi bacterium]|nr:hypothetical protein [Chloroflexota bacterium]